jgi:hypothetical protein
MVTVFQNAIGDFSDGGGLADAPSDNARYVRKNGLWVPAIGAKFRATTSTTQAISAATVTEVNFGTELFDTHNAFSANRFTVPAELNGLYMNFVAALRFATNETCEIYIVQSTDGGSNWNSLCQGSSSGVAVNGSVGPVLLVTGHKYAVQTYSTTTATISDVDMTHFGGFEVF